MYICIYLTVFQGTEYKESGVSTDRLNGSRVNCEKRLNLKLKSKIWNIVALLQLMFIGVHPYIMLLFPPGLIYSWCLL